MKKYLKVLSIIVVVIMFCLSLSVTAFADDEIGSEEEYADRAEFYDFMSYDKKTKEERHTVAVNADAHISNFTINFVAGGVKEPDSEKISEETLRTKYGITNLASNKTGTVLNFYNYLLNDYTDYHATDNGYYDYTLLGSQFYYNDETKKIGKLADKFLGFYKNMETDRFEIFGSDFYSNSDENGNSIYDGNHYLAVNNKGEIKSYVDHYAFENYRIDGDYYSSEIQEHLILIEQDKIIDIHTDDWICVVKQNSKSCLPAGIYYYNAIGDLINKVNTQNLAKNSVFGEIETTLDGLMSSGISHGRFAVTYNGAENISNENSYTHRGGQRIVNLFSFTVKYTDRKYGFWCLYDEFGSQALAGSMRNGQVYRLEGWCATSEFLCGDYDFDGEVTIKDLIVAQLLQVNSEYTKNFIYDIPFIANSYLMEYIECEKEGIFYSAQYLQMYLCEEISFGDFCNNDDFGVELSCMLKEYIYDAGEPIVGESSSAYHWSDEWDFDK